MSSIYKMACIIWLLLRYIPLRAQYATRITVAQDGSGDYSSIQSALDNTKSFPDQPISIFIKKGVYREKVRVYPPWRAFAKTVFILWDYGPHIKPEGWDDWGMVRGKHIHHKTINQHAKKKNLH